MNTVLKNVTLMALCGAIPGIAAAQQASPPAGPASTPPNATAQSEAGEPRADTGGVPAPAPAASPAAHPASAAAAAGRTAGAGHPPAGPAQKPANSADRLELGTATVTGSQEQPKVMYIVPWKRSDIGDLAGKPMNSLVDEILAPVDREVFKREVVYYQVVQADASQKGASSKPPPQGEK